jgi:carbonic anhydrase
MGDEGPEWSRQRWRHFVCEICRLENPARQAQPSRRGLLRFLGTAAAGLALVGTGIAKEVKTPPKPQNVVSPDASLELLMKGNDRYVEGDSRRHDFKQEREALVGGQNPYAGILSCADSRIAPEYAFDSGRGDLFVCRVAGNFANSDTIASMEYAVAMLGTPLIMVLLGTNQRAGYSEQDVERFRAWRWHRVVIHPVQRCFGTESGLATFAFSLV